MTDRDSVQRWLDDYVSAWKSYDREEIAALFNDEVEYRFHPYDEPVRGREAVVAAWLGEGDDEAASERDAPGTYDAGYEPVAVDGEVAVAKGASTYTSEPGGPVTAVYDNCFLLRFDAEGRCLEFTEYFMKRPQPG
jgi:ketosteroid isomerase-like protein